MATDHRVVIDASAGVRACLVDGWASLATWELVAPTLFWSEAAAGIRQLAYRDEITDRQASDALGRLVDAPVAVFSSRELVTAAHKLAVDLGWAKTYDAEYLVLAQRLDVPLLTLDARLATTARRFVKLAL